MHVSYKESIKLSTHQKTGGRKTKDLLQLTVHILSSLPQN